MASRGVDARFWSEYEQHLIAVGKDEAQWERRGLVGLSKGWALGTQGWRKALAEDHAQQCLSVGLERHESRELKEGAWGLVLSAALSAAGKTTADLKTKPKKQVWKLELARRLRSAGAAVGWIADKLDLGKPASVRSYLSRG